jgi:hypothetical protein
VEQLRAGLCASCRHHQLVESRRSTFLLCRRGLTDPAYRKYPSLPVVACPGFENAAEPPDAESQPDPDGKLSR